MANIKSAIKRARQNPKRRLHNASRRSTMRTFIKHVTKAIESGDVESAKTSFITAQSMIDNAASKGLIHKNTASRTKSRLNARVKSMSQSA
mgnify:CR=1 FL=1